MVTTKLLFSAIEAAKLLTFPKLKCFGNRLPSRDIRLRRCSIPQVTWRIARQERDRHPARVAATISLSQRRRWR